MRKLLGTRYTGASDHASLLFASITGFSSRISTIPNIDNLLNSPRYNLVQKYSSETVQLILNTVPRDFVSTPANEPNPTVRSNSGTVSYNGIPPYVRLAMQEESIFERIMVFYQNTVAGSPGINDLLEKYGMPIVDDGVSKSQLFRDNIIYYYPIINRPLDSPGPYSLYLGDRATIRPRVKIYTPQELIDTFDLEIPAQYYMPDLWDSVIDYINKIELR